MSVARWVKLAMWAAGAACVAMLFAANIWLGEVNQDEGWYLYGARLVAEGRLPYRDFATTQGPVLFMVYGWLWPVFGAHGLLGGRLLTAAFGALSLALTARLAGRVAGGQSRERGAVAAFLAFCLAGINVYQTYFLSVVKTYSLCVLLVMCGFVLLASKRRAGARAFLSGVFFAAAVMTRLSAVGMAAGACLVMAWEAFRDKRARGTPAFFVAGGLLGAAVFLAPFALMAPRGVWFAFVDYHTGRVAGSLAAALVYKAGFVSRVVSAYFVSVALCVAGLAADLGARGAWKRWVGNGGEEGVSAGTASASVTAMLWLGAALTTAIHAAAAFPYDDYQVIVFPAFAAALSIALVRVGVERFRLDAGALFKAAATIALLCAGAAFSSPRNQDWVAGRRDRIWWPLRTETSLGQVRRVGHKLRAMAAERSETMLLTQDIYLAVESGLRVPRGLELGPFSYFPDWSDERAAAIGVLNRRGLLAAIESGEAGLAAVSGYGLSIRAPDIAPLTELERAELEDALKSRYALVYSEPDFGQAMTRLDVYELKPESKTVPLPVP